MVVVLSSLVVRTWCTCLFVLFIIRQDFTVVNPVDQAFRLHWDSVTNFIDLTDKRGSTLGMLMIYYYSLVRILQKHLSNEVCFCVRFHGGDECLFVTETDILVIVDLSSKMFYISQHFTLAPSLSSLLQIFF